MNCDDCHPLLEAYADGELDLVRHLALEAHLKACPACSRRYEAIAARRASLRASLPRFTAPQHLRDKIHASLRSETRDAARREPIRFPVAGPNWVYVGLAASIAVSLLIGFQWGDRRAHASSILEDAFSEHVRSLQANHLMDVVSTDRHTVKPWFAGKLDFSPPVADLADIGFPLAGGRLELIDGRSAAALVFRRRLHAINLFIWPESGSSSVPRRAGENGFSAQGWTKGGLNFLAVSEIPASDLEQFVGEFRKRTE
jgi:anti-sigma factor RsiW